MITIVLNLATTWFCIVFSRFTPAECIVHVVTYLEGTPLPEKPRDTETWFRLRQMLGYIRETLQVSSHDDVIKWKHFPRYWPFVRGIHRTKASDVEFWCFLWSALNKRLSKQPWAWWFKTPSWSLWRHRNANFRGARRSREKSATTLKMSYDGNLYSTSLSHLPLMPQIYVQNLELVHVMACHLFACTWTNVALLSIGPLGTNFSEILHVIKLQNFSFTKMHLKISLHLSDDFEQGKFSKEVWQNCLHVTW